MPIPLTGDDLRSFLIDHRLVESCTAATAALGLFVAAGIEQFETDTGFSPFIADPTPQTLTLDIPDGLSAFPPVGIVSVASLTVDGSAMTQGTHYWLRHRHKPTSGPYQCIEFGSPLYGARGGLVLSCVVGYALELPARAKLGILSWAAAEALTKLSGPSGIVRRDETGPVKYEYDTTAGRDTPSQLRASYEEAVDDFRRWV